MELAALFLLGVFSVLFALADAYLTPRFLALPALQGLQGSYAGRVAVRAAAVMGLLVLVSLAMSFAAKKPNLPSA